jgi:alkylated DNA repair dioxygenase AlkB
MKKEIALIIIIFIVYNYFMSSEYVDDKTLSIKLIPLSMFGLFAFFIFVISILSIFYYRTTNYVNHLKDDWTIYDEKFHYIKVFNLSIPDQLINPLMNISENQGVRVEIPKKRQKCISLKRLQESLPEIVEFYKSLPPIISKIIGAKVQITPLSEPNSLCLVVYEKEGDYIDWHFDTNHYNGRYFTLLLPISTTPTCGNYQFRNSKQKTQTVKLEQGQALLFEGDKVYHKAKKLCKNQRRVILSCTFTTSQEIPTIEIIFQKIKNIGIFGEV